MAKTFVNAGRRRQFTPTLAHKVGDLVYRDGFFGIAQDDATFSTTPTAVDRPFMHTLDGVWDIGNVFQGANIVGGARVYAQPTYQGTTLQLYPAASIAAGGVAIGRLWATYVNGASYARVALFGPENQHTAL